MEPNFKRLLENITLTEQQSDDAITKYTGVCQVLHQHYYPDKGYNGSTKFLIGSYGKCTNIRPPRDIDVVFKLPDDQFERFDNLSGNKQSQLLQEIRSILKERYPRTEDIKAWGKVVVVGFAEGSHTVEVLPAWERNKKFKFPNSENGGSWEISDPRSEMDNINNSNRQTGITISLIRICKKWAEYCNVEIDSFILEIIMTNGY